MEKYIPPDIELGFPYEEEVERLRKEFSEFETRVTLDSSEEVDRWELDYGWQAVLYENSEGFFANLRQKFSKTIFNPPDFYRTKPEYQWEIIAPNGELYRRKGLDLFPEEFESIIDSRERN